MVPLILGNPHIGVPLFWETTKFAKSRKAKLSWIFFVDTSGLGTLGKLQGHFAVGKLKVITKRTVIARNKQTLACIVSKREARWVLDGLQVSGFGFAVAAGDMLHAASNVSIEPSSGMSVLCGSVNACKALMTTGDFATSACQKPSCHQQMGSYTPAPLLRMPCKCLDLQSCNSPPEKACKLEAILTFFELDGLCTAQHRPGSHFAMRIRTPETAMRLPSPAHHDPELPVVPASADGVPLLPTANGIPAVQLLS